MSVPAGTLITPRSTACGAERPSISWPRLPHGRLGFTDADISHGGSDRLVDELIAWGNPGAIAGRVREQHEAGADHVCIQVLSNPPQDLKTALDGTKPVPFCIPPGIKLVKVSLRTGLKALPESVNFAYVTSCDVPLLVPGFVTRMIDLVGAHDIAVMEIDGFPHPLSAVYRRDTLPRIESLLERDMLRPVFLVDAVRTRRVRPEEMASVDPQLLTLRNLNTRDDYLAALADAGFAAGG